MVNEETDEQIMSIPIIFLNVFKRSAIEDCAEETARSASCEGSYDGNSFPRVLGLPQLIVPSDFPIYSRKCLIVHSDRITDGQKPYASKYRQNRVVWHPGRYHVYPRYTT
ncbi:uncharacterized protein RAG0_02586 [Rhynchosporium agropyri]|uniref:Uncharacterized protein n=1 Tax=Rhynchosporium agropyri TaxID=914238 RepID=A0A1E1K1S1_9HELO|nr:uncharacterized protein RAG0_02586 [Rhynchosporium agropyri]